MKSIRIATIAVAAASLLGRRARPRPPAVDGAAKTVTISVASLIPGSTHAGDPAVQRAGRPVREGQPDDQGQAGRVPVDRPDLRRQARRRHAADRVRGAVHRRAHARRQRPARRPDGRGQEAAVLLEVQPGRPRRGTDAKGKIVALPKGAYAQALHYNRKLFQQAGLDPNKPPTTWAQLAGRRAADRAEDRQGRLRRDGEGRQHRRLDPDHARLRARRPHGDGQRHERQRDAQQPADRHGAEHAQARCAGPTTRWARTSTTAGATSTRRSPPATSACTSAARTSTRTSCRRSNIDPSIYGLAPIPLAKNKNAGVLGGGTLVAVKPTRTRPSWRRR